MCNQPYKGTVRDIKEEKYHIKNNGNHNHINLYYIKLYIAQNVIVQLICCTINREEMIDKPTMKILR